MIDMYGEQAYQYDHAPKVDDKGNTAESDEMHLRIKRSTDERLFAVRVKWMDNQNEWGAARRRLMLCEMEKSRDQGGSAALFMEGK